MEIPIDYTHPSWRTAAGTAVSYTLILVVMFVVLFVLPFVLWTAI